MMRVLIVDDEAPARDKLRRLLGREADVEIVAEAGDGEAAVRAVREHAPDVVFLDIQMPRLDGFGVVREVGVAAMPFTVFVTAYDQHALDAFEVRALDYLLKPFGARRFGEMMQRVREALAERSAASLTERLQALLEGLEERAAEPPPASKEGTAPKRLMVEKSENRQVLLDLARVKVIRADGNYLRFVTDDGEYSRRGTLRAVEERLGTEEFLRINRSEIVRLDAVKEFQPWFHGDYRVILEDGSLLTWSRRYRSRFDDGF